MADDLVVNALRKAIERDTEFRLVSVGEAPDEAGLFPDRKGPAKKAIQVCTEGEKPLLHIREEAGKSKTPNQFARITDRGITTLAAQTPLRKFTELIAAAAPRLRTKVLRSCLRSLAKRSGELDRWAYRRLVQTCLTATDNQFAVIEGRLQEVIVDQQELGDSMNEFLRSVRTRMESQKEKLTGELDSLVKAVKPFELRTEASAEGQQRRPQLPVWQRVATANPEIDFQKNLSEELVFAWQDATSPETRAALERAMFNVGLERLNAPGDTVAFDGVSQHTDDDVAEGELVEVVLPGWQLTNLRGASLLARAKVVKTSRPINLTEIHMMVESVVEMVSAHTGAAALDVAVDSPPQVEAPTSESASSADAAKS